MTMGAGTVHCKGAGSPYTAWLKRPTSPTPGAPAPFDIIRRRPDSRLHGAPQHPQVRCQADAKVLLEIKKRRVRGKSLAALKGANTGEVVRKSAVKLSLTARLSISKGCAKQQSLLKTETYEFGETV